MIVDILNNEIVITSDSKQTLPVLKSQFSFWGYRYFPDSNQYKKSLKDESFLSIIKYLDKKRIKYELTRTASDFSEELELRKLGFEKLKENVEQFKNGDFNEIDFRKFRDFASENLNRSLRIHQLKAAFHLYSIGNGANFSVPGSGKTSVVLSVYEKLRLEGKVNTLFVIGPPSSFGPWKSEFYETLGRKPRCTILAGGNKNKRKSQYFTTARYKSELYLTTFQSLLFDQDEVKFFFNQSDINIFLVVDEAHYIKKINGNWASAVLNQSKKVKYRCVLTGTPMPKSYSDVYNLFDFLWPEQQVLSNENKLRINHFEKNGNRIEAKEILDKTIGPLFYRVRKSDLKLTKPNFLKPDIINMNSNERLVYDAIVKRIRDYSKKDYFKNIDFVNKLGRGRVMRLRQCISYTKLLETAIEEYEENLFEDVINLKEIVKNYNSIEIPAKLNFLLKKVEKLNADGQKVVIWSNFIGTIKLIEKHIKDLGIDCNKIFGDTPVEGTTLRLEETREKIRDKFVSLDSGLDVLIANPAACAESISLHKTCHHAIYYDLSYNCAQFLQSLDRIHRVGGSETVEANYHFLQYRDTIDADIKENLDRKTHKMYEVIEEEYPIYSLDMFEEDSDMEAYKRMFKK